MVKIGVLGGSFDPVTYAHLLQASELLSFRTADNPAEPFFSKVYLIPSGDNRYDKQAFVPAAARLGMLEDAVKWYKEQFDSNLMISVNDIEIKNGRHMPTYELHEQLQAADKDNDYFFIVGADLVPKIHTWKQSAYLICHVPFFVLPRFGFDREGVDNVEVPKSLLWAGESGSFDIASMTTSSTEVRKRLSVFWGLSDVTKKELKVGCTWTNQSILAQQLIAGLVVPPVTDAIWRHQFYKPA